MEVNGLNINSLPHAALSQCVLRGEIVLLPHLMNINSPVAVAIFRLLDMVSPLLLVVAKW